MISRSLLTESIDIVLRVAGVTTSRYGDPVDDEIAPTTVLCKVMPLAATEEEINRDTRISRYRVYLEPTVEVDGLASVTWRGREYEVIGEPRDRTHPQEGVHHREFEMREILG